MSDNHEIEQDSEASSDPESIDDLFLSPDDSHGEEIPFADPPEDETPQPVPPPAQQAPQSPAAAPIVNEGAMANLEAERDDYRNRMMRVAADLENFRKRTAREREDMRKYGIDRVVLELLPVLDNLERALQHADQSADSTTIVDGVRMVQRQFVTALEKHGVQGFDSKGEQFDPQKHEAIQQIETAEHPTGHVLDEYQKGYYLHERLIRPALVVVARNPNADTIMPEPDEPQPPDASDASSPASEPASEMGAESSGDSDGSDESAVN